MIYYKWRLQPARTPKHSLHHLATVSRGVRVHSDSLLKIRKIVLKIEICTAGVFPFRIDILSLNCVSRVPKVAQRLIVSRVL